jgi:hypothetical protein
MTIQETGDRIKSTRIALISIHEGTPRIPKTREEIIQSIQKFCGSLFDVRLFVAKDGALVLDHE